MFIKIFEDGEKTVSHFINQEELDAVEDGVLEIIRVETITPITEYYKGEWKVIK